MSRIKEIWNSLKGSDCHSVGMRSQVLEYEGKVNCILGFIPITGIKVFQLEIEKDIKIERNWLKKFRGSEIQILPSKNANLFSILLLDSSLDDIFILFIEDIINSLKETSDSIEAIKLITSKVGYWKKLFARATGELLSAEKQRGLFGELFFLSLLLQNSSNHQEALHSWRGAESANQDFARNGNSVEIKTSKANNPSVHISNEQQLDFTAWDHLFLGLISVDETTGNQNSLASIIEEIKDLINHDPRLTEEFEIKLEHAGVSGDMIESYNEISYSINNVRFFKIQDGFPVILRGNIISDAIYNVKYQIDIASCGSFESQEEDVIRVMI